MNSKKDLRILFVDDEEGLRELIADALTSMGLDVVKAQNGVEALVRLDGGDGFDVVISDISMPGGVSGIDLARQVHERYPEARTILASGHARSQLPELPDFVEYISKPYRIRELFAMLVRS